MAVADPSSHKGKPRSLHFQMQPESTRFAMHGFARFEFAQRDGSRPQTATRHDMKREPVHPKLWRRRQFVAGGRLKFASPCLFRP
jgi:hypothetical protein